MSARGLKWLAAAGTIVLAAAFGRAVASVPKPDGASLRPKVEGQAPIARPTSGVPQTITYVS